MKKKEYSCPDCKVWLNTCEGCQRYYEKEKDKSSDSTHSMDYNDLVNRGYKDLLGYSFVRDYAVDSISACDKCSHNPKNGGSGICHCTIPYLKPPTTAGASTVSTTYSNDNVTGTSDLTITM